MVEAIKIHSGMLDVDSIRRDFPVLAKTIHGKPLVYLDNGATTQKPKLVIDRIHKFESEEYSTVRRGAYKLCEDSTRYYEETRQKVANLLGTHNKKEIIFTIAIAIMCFSIALWALAMNHIKYQNILGTFKIINSHSQNAYYK